MLNLNIRFSTPLKVVQHCIENNSNCKCEAQCFVVSHVQFFCLVNSLNLFLNWNFGNRLDDSVGKVLAV